jgi:hypothetical protein
MSNESSDRDRDPEMVRNAYNAAFHELGLRWFWDSETHLRLSRQGITAQEQVRHYLESQQPHLLKAYDANFLVDAILRKQAQHCELAASRGATQTRPFDWAVSVAGELGA